MGLEALGVAGLLGVASATGSALTLAAWNRTREARFLLVAAAQWALLALAVLWAAGQVLAAPPEYARADLPVMGLTTLAAIFLVLGSLLPRAR
jgi:hypothetical protein